MKTIKENITHRYEINKSIFITNLIKVKSKEEALLELNKIKEKYSDATHNCYCYIIDDIKKSSDDNDPGGTAGVPITEVLLKNNINYILCVVTRYFGGIKLGAGGLVRAYSTSVSNALKNADLIELIDGYKIKIEIDYNIQKQLEHIIKKFKFTKIYNEKVNYLIYCPEEVLILLKRSNINYEIIQKEKIELS